MTVVVGCVGELFQGDLDAGRHVAERLLTDDLGADVVVEEFYYGAIAVMQRLQDLEPTALVLVGAEHAGERPGSVRRQRIRVSPAASWDIQDAVGAAATGYVAMPLVINVAAGFGVLPWRSTTIEIEPATVDPVDHLSPAVDRGVADAVSMIRREVRRIRLLEQADTVQRDLDDESLTTREPRLDATSLRLLRLLLRELRRLDDDGHWGAAPAIAERLHEVLVQRAGDAGDGGAQEASSVRALLEMVDDVCNGEASLRT